MRLRKILKDLNIKKEINFKNFNIKSATHISKDVEKSSMFICIQGNNYDGNDFANLAVSCGAKCIVSEKELNIPNVTTIVVDDIRKSMSIIAKNFYLRAVDDLEVYGVVGTSGKTTTTMILSSIFKEIDNSVGVIGTNGIYIGNICMENKFTTPDPLELHYVFYQMKLLGVKRVVMEISAQAISQSKMYGIILSKCIFTNITEEHLDFFGSMERYARCKMDYFSKTNMRECVVNVDDFFGMEIAYKTQVPCVSYAIENPANSFAVNIEYQRHSTRFVANIFDDVIDIDTSLVGEYNVYNLLGAITVAKLVGIENEHIKKAIKKLMKIDGRFEVVEKFGRHVIVDFAHTPDGFEKILSQVKKFATGRIITVFGCVGYSDQEKRIQMGKVASKYSDQIVVTTDNRCKETFDSIAKDIVLGIDKPYLLIENRINAIHEAMKMSKDNDTICILGKGIERFQTVEDGKESYCGDLQVVNSGWELLKDENSVN